MDEIVGLPSVHGRGKREETPADPEVSFIENWKPAGEIHTRRNACFGTIVAGAVLSIATQNPAFVAVSIVFVGWFLLNSFRHRNDDRGEILWTIYGDEIETNEAALCDKFIGLCMEAGLITKRTRIDEVEISVEEVNPPTFKFWSTQYGQTTNSVKAAVANMCPSFRAARVNVEELDNNTTLICFFNDDLFVGIGSPVYWRDYNNG